MLVKIQSCWPLGKLYDRWSHMFTYIAVSVWFIYLLCCLLFIEELTIWHVLWLTVLWNGGCRCWGLPPPFEKNAILSVDV
uniref:Uncharacterized protein n=1 Tax=Arundo donax TaxID=35708 RepID=A0A0A9BPI9_ARUDO